MRSDRKQTILFIIILLILSMGIGYAFLTTTLSIDGVSDIDSSSWDVHFENVQVQSGSITGSQVITPATISADGQTVSYHIKLNEPGDNYTFKVDIVNGGSLNATISNILFKINGVEATMAPEYLAQYVMLDGYNPLTISQLICPGETKTLISGIHYREDIDPEDLPTEDTSLTISFGLVYGQMSSSGYVYSYNYSALVGDSIINTGVYYDNLSFSINDFGYNSSLRYKINNYIVEEIAVGFIYNGNEYYLLPGSDSSTLEYNKNVLRSAFDASLCSESSFSMECIDEDNNYLDVVASTVDTFSRNGVYGCNIHNGNATCGIITLGE